jgi:hypothetical protein
MARITMPALPSEEPGDRPSHRSDGKPAKHGYLGGFTRYAVRFSVYELGPSLNGFPDFPNRFLVDVDDGAGPRECCRFTDAADDEPVWNGAWNGDDWCPWILDQSRALMPDLGPD